MAGMNIRRAQESHNHRASPSGHTRRKLRGPASGNQHTSPIAGRRTIGMPTPGGRNTKQRAASQLAREQYAVEEGDEGRDTASPLGSPRMQSMRPPLGARQVSFGVSTGFAVPQSNGPVRRTLRQDDLKIAMDQHLRQGAGGGGGGGARPKLQRQGSSLDAEHLARLSQSAQPVKRSLGLGDAVIGKMSGLASAPAAAAAAAAAARGGGGDDGGKQGKKLSTRSFSDRKLSGGPSTRGMFHGLRKMSAGGAATSITEMSANNSRAKRQADFSKEVDAMKVHLRQGGGWVIDPNSPFMRKWDLVTIVALFFTATITPYEVALLTTQLNFLFVVNRLIDLVFTVDMVMQFFLIFRESTELGGGWIRDRGRIRRHYLKGWFTIDLVSILPFDIVAFALKDGALGKMKALRIIRLLRLLKLVRIVRASRIFKRWETSISISYSVLSLIKFLLMIIIFGHWLACAWALLHDSGCDRECTEAVAVGNDSPGDTWLVAWIRAHGTPGMVPAPNEIYTLAMYWSIMTLTSIGYGDIAAQTHIEYGFATVFMLIGAITWAYIIGSTCGIVATLDVETMQFRQTMDQLNAFMADELIPQALRRELRGYFHQARTLQAASAQKSLLDHMSPMLKGRVADHTVGGIVRKVPYFHGAEAEFLVEIAQHVENMVFAPNEVLDEGDLLYHLVRGIVALGGRVLSHGAVWGEDMILGCTEYQDTAAAMSLTYVEVVTLSKLDLEEVVEWFPKTAALLRKSLVKMTVQRGLIIEARKIKRARAEGKAVDSAGGMLAQLGVPDEQNIESNAVMALRKRKSSSRRMSSTQAREIKEIVVQAQLEAEAEHGGGGGDQSEEPTTPGRKVQAVGSLAPTSPWRSDDSKSRHLAPSDSDSDDHAHSGGGGGGGGDGGGAARTAASSMRARSAFGRSRSTGRSGSGHSSGTGDPAAARRGSGGNGSSGSSGSLAIADIEDVVRRCMKEVLAQQYIAQQFQLQQAKRIEAEQQVAGGQEEQPAEEKPRRRSRSKKATAAALTVGSALDAIHAAALPESPRRSEAPAPEAPRIATDPPAAESEGAAKIDAGVDDAALKDGDLADGAGTKASPQVEL
jgi:potassium voltage-gated channel Eag-related subfamily H protein 7